MSIGVQVDDNGISVKSYREVRTALAERMQAIFGASLDLSPSSPDGQLLDLFCYAYNDAAQAIQGGYAELDVNSASGTFLDNIGTIMGVPRNGIEDDDVYRALIISSDVKGLATFDTMVTYLVKNIGVGVTMINNDEPEEDNGIPGHSFAVFVPDTLTEITDDQIAQAIWKCKPAGIKSFGSSSGTAVDKLGTAHTVQFNRVTKTDAYYMRISVTEYTEEQLPDDFQEQVAHAVAVWAVGEFTQGKDIIPKRAVQAVYKVPGIDDVTIEVSADGETGWTEDRIPIDIDKYAYVPEENITVTKVT